MLSLIRCTYEAMKDKRLCMLQVTPTCHSRLCIGIQLSSLAVRRWGFTLSAGTIPVAEAHPDQPPPEVPPDQAMQLNSAVNRALMQNPLTGSTHRSASAQPAKLQAGGSEGGAGWGGSQSGQDWQQQIEKDLHRTFPGHPVMDKTGRSALRRILLAYSVHNPDVGYCQVGWGLAAVLHVCRSQRSLTHRNSSAHWAEQRAGVMQNNALACQPVVWAHRGVCHTC